MNKWQFCAAKLAKSANYVSSTFLGGNRKIMLVMTSYAKNYASTICHSLVSSTPPPPPHHGIAPRWGYDFACTFEYNIPMYIELNWLAKTMGRSDCNHMFAHSQTYSGLRSVERALSWIIQLDW